MHPVIAIDGPAASGKSSLARHAAARLGYTYLNTGLMYRALAWRLLQLGIDPADEAACTAALPSLHLHCGLRDGRSTITLDHLEPTTEQLNATPVNNAVSQVARQPAIRALLLPHQRHYPALAPCVAEGRDTCTVVFPHTPHKYYLHATEAVRAARRAAQGITDPVAARDHADSTRAAAPLRTAPDAIILDTSHLDLPATLDLLLHHLATQGITPPAP